MENEIAEGGNVINHNTVSLLNQRTRFCSFTKMRNEFIFHFLSILVPYKSSQGYGSLLEFSVRYNGVIRNKTEKTKETAGTRVGFWFGLATCWCYRKAYATTGGTRGQEYTKKI